MTSEPIRSCFMEVSKKLKFNLISAVHNEGVYSLICP